jgi:hypothetical protein
MVQHHSVGKKFFVAKMHLVSSPCLATFNNPSTAEQIFKKLRIVEVY